MALVLYNVTIKSDVYSRSSFQHQRESGNVTLLRTVGYKYAQEDEMKEQQ